MHFPSLPPRPERSYPREELDEMLRRWLDANRRAEAERDWKRNLGPLYAPDAEYRWQVGPGREFIARTRDEIGEWALGYQMLGFEEWTYPYERVVIDEKLGEVVGFWCQVSPHTRPDGSPYAVRGLSGSWFRYGGNYQWSHQIDFFDLANIVTLMGELAARGKLDPKLERRIQDLAWGKLMPGESRVGGDGLWQKVEPYLALGRVVLGGLASGAAPLVALIQPRRALLDR